MNSNNRSRATVVCVHEWIHGLFSATLSPENYAVRFFPTRVGIIILSTNARAFFFTCERQIRYDETKQTSQGKPFSPNWKRFLLYAAPRVFRNVTCTHVKRVKRIRPISNEANRKTKRLRRYISLALAPEERRDDGGISRKANFVYLKGYVGRAEFVFS